MEVRLNDKTLPVVSLRCDAFDLYPLLLGLLRPVFEHLALHFELPHILFSFTHTLFLA